MSEHGAHPFAELLGLQHDDYGDSDGSSSVSLLLNESLLNPNGVAHGAVLYALADTGMGAALFPTLAQGEFCATVEIKINYFKAVSEGLITAKTHIVHRGKRLVNLESCLYQGEALIAKANGNFAILMPRK